jgi:hypothetical protein
MWRTGLPVRSAILKPHAGQLVLKSVTIWESWLLIVFALCFASFYIIFHFFFDGVVVTLGFRC